MFRDAGILLSVFLHNRKLCTDTRFAVPNKNCAGKKPFRLRLGLGVDFPGQLCATGIRVDGVSIISPPETTPPLLGSCVRGQCYPESILGRPRRKQTRAPSTFG